MFLAMCQHCCCSRVHSASRYTTPYLVCPNERAGGNGVERDVADETPQTLRLFQAGVVQVGVHTAPLQLPDLVHVCLPVTHEEQELRGGGRGTGRARSALRPVIGMMKRWRHVADHHCRCSCFLRDFFTAAAAVVVHRGGGVTSAGRVREAFLLGAAAAVSGVAGGGRRGRAPPAGELSVESLERVRVRGIQDIASATATATAAAAVVARGCGRSTLRVHWWVVAVQSLVGHVHVRVCRQQRVRVSLPCCCNHALLPCAHKVDHPDSRSSSSGMHTAGLSFRMRSIQGKLDKVF